MSDWISLHAFHGGDLDRMLRDAVDPAIGRLCAAGEVRRWFFLRYWEGGPHLRLRADAAPGRTASVTTALTDALTTYLSAHPSATWPGSDDYAKLAALLAAQEHLADYECVPRPVDSVAAVPYRPESDVYDTGAAMDATEDHFAESSRIALDVIHSCDWDRRRALMRMFLVGSLSLLEPDLDRLAAGFAAGASLADRRFAAYPMSARFAAGYEACREEVAEQIRAVWTTGPVGLDPAVTAWIDSVRRLRDRRAATPPLPSGPAGSPLAWHIYALPDAAHAVGAVVLRCTHLMSNRMGIAMAEEIGGGYEVARALTDRALAGRAGAR